MGQIIFVDTKTHIQHLYPPDFVFSHLPRIGEHVCIFDDNGQGDDDIVLEGKVGSIGWSFGNTAEDENDYSVFIEIESDVVDNTPSE